jgi:hypothetical protein
MAKSQNHGKTKAWRKPEFYMTADGERKLNKQRPHVRRKTKGTVNSVGAWMSPLLANLFGRVGLINKELPQV